MEKSSFESQKEDHKHKHVPDTIKSTLMFSEHIRVTAMVAVITLSTIGLMSGAGYLLDKQLNASPLFLIAGLVVSFPLSQFVIFRWVKKHYVPRVAKKSSSENHSE